MNDLLLVHLVVGVAIYKNGKFLLVQEKLPKAYGQWNWPAGKVESGLSVQENAIKEVKEETGFNVQLGTLIGIFPKQSKFEEPLYLFQGTIIDGELNIPEDEIMDAQWFTLEEIGDLQLRDPWVLAGAKLIVEKTEGVKDC